MGEPEVVQQQSPGWACGLGVSQGSRLVVILVFALEEDELELVPEDGSGFEEVVEDVFGLGIIVKASGVKLGYDSKRGCSKDGRELNQSQAVVA